METATETGASAQSQVGASVTHRLRLPSGKCSSVAVATNDPVSSLYDFAARKAEQPIGCILLSHSIPPIQLTQPSATVEDANLLRPTLITVAIVSRGPCATPGWCGTTSPAVYSTPPKREESFGGKISRSFTTVKVFFSSLTQPQCIGRDVFSSSESFKADDYTDQRELATVVSVEDVVRSSSVLQRGDGAAKVVRSPPHPDSADGPQVVGAVRNTISLPPADSAEGLPESKTADADGRASGEEQTEGDARRKRMTLKLHYGRLSEGTVTRPASVATPGIEVEGSFADALAQLRSRAGQPQELRMAEGGGGAPDDGDVVPPTPPMRSRTPKSESRVRSAMSTVSGEE